jgi:PEGA domain
MKKALLALSALIVLGSAFAQVKSPLNAQLKPPLIIICNENNADVFINGQPVAKTTRDLVIRLAPGVYSVRVAKAGFEDYIDDQVSVGSQDGATLKITLRPAPIAAQAPAPMATAPAPIAAQAPAPISQAPAMAAAPAQVIAPTPAPGADMTMNARPAPAPTLVPAPASPNSANRAFVGAGFPLNVDSNVRGAQIYVNGRLVGQTPLGLEVSRGVYEIRVTAPGYQDFVQNLNVRSPERVNAVLQSLLSQLTVSANVQGADVIINGQAVGKTPLVIGIAPGAYSLVVRAPGYMDYQLQLSVNGPQSINAVLQGALASWQLLIPENAAKGWSKEATEQEGRRGMQLWVDGVPERDFAGQLTPGRHVLRLVAGDLAVERQIDVQAGRTYVFEPFLDINVR